MSSRRRGARILATALLALTVPALGTLGVPATADQLDGSVLSGPAALSRLRADGGLAEAAERAGTTTAGLTRLLSDRTTRLAGNGRVFYAEDRTPAQRVTTSAFTPVAPLPDTFTLHSRPGSKRTLLLDFDGQLVTGTWWNDPTIAGTSTLPNGFHAPYSLDGDPAFSNAERLVVQEVWARVAEDYAPFDVDVTTQDPGTAAIDRSSASDTTYGVRVVVTPGTAESTTMCGGQCSGIAWIDVFDWALDGGSGPGPAWVMTDLTWGDPWEIADTASHESGHTLGLEHDGKGSADYYVGRGIWGPIMGSTSLPLVQWSNGDYTGATQKQDDLAVISGNGAPRLADDFADTIGGTAPAPGDLGSGGSGSVSGIVSDRSDQDVLGYAHGACPVTFTLTTATPAPDLDARLRVLAADGTQLASVDPPAAAGPDQTLTGTGATWTGDLPAGTTYVEVDGVGQGAMPDAGYSDYGSVGRWTVAVSGCADDGSVAPSAPTGLTLTRTTTMGRAVLSWQAPADPGTQPVTGYRVSSPVLGADPVTVTGRSLTVTGLKDLQTASYTVRALSGAGVGLPATASLTYHAPTPPSVPTNVRAASGAAGGAVTASVSWARPARDGGTPVTGYRLSATRYDAAGRAVRTWTATRSASVRTWVATLPAGTYRFRVAAVNAAGRGPLSARTALVRAR